MPVALELRSPVPFPCKAHKAKGQRTRNRMPHAAPFASVAAKTAVLLRRSEPGPAHAVLHVRSLRSHIARQRLLWSPAAVTHATLSSMTAAPALIAEELPSLQKLR